MKNCNTGFNMIIGISFVYHVVGNLSTHFRRERVRLFIYFFNVSIGHVLEKKTIILKSAATSSIREYTASKIFDSGISQIKREIAFLATLTV